MLGSFFPRPALFFLSAIIWTALLVVFWYGYGTQLGQIFGFDIIEDREAVIGLGFFRNSRISVVLYILFHSKCIICRFSGLFGRRIAGSFGQLLAPSLFYSQLIFSVQVSVALNYWRRPFF